MNSDHQLCVRHLAVTQVHFTFPRFLQGATNPNCVCHVNACVNSEGPRDQSVQITSPGIQRSANQSSGIQFVHLRIRPDS